MDVIYDGYYIPPTEDEKIRKNRNKKIKRLNSIFILNKLIEKIKMRI